MASKKLLLIDTNIISHALTPKQTTAYAKLMAQYQDEYTFVVTDYTQYELLRSSSKERQKATKVYLAQNMGYAKLSETLMDFTARVYNLYKVHKSTKNLTITTGDIVNAAFAIAKDTPVMTIDNNDYPTPFFKEIGRERVHYNSSKDREVMDTAYVLVPNMENIRYCFSQHNL